MASSPSTYSHKLSIIIPVFNEERTILDLYKKIKNVTLSDIEKEIIIVDDGSTDSTSQKLKTLNDPDRQTKMVRHQKNLGKGAAIKTGLQQVTGDIVIIQDADLEYDPNDYKKIIAPIIQDKAQVVYGSRRLNNTNEHYASIIYYIGGISLTKITNFLYGSTITDEATGYKAFKTNVLTDLHLECKNFEFCPEVTAKLLRKKIKIEEVSISYYPRSKLDGKKIRFKDGFQAVWTLLKWRWKRI